MSTQLLIDVEHAIDDGDPVLPEIAYKVIQLILNNEAGDTQGGGPTQTQSTIYKE